jgi:hypothetical protein
MGTKLSDYLAESEAVDTPEHAAVRAMFAAGIALGLQFRDARVGRGLTRAELSGLAGIPQADISRIERGAGNPPEGFADGARYIGYRCLGDRRDH